MVLQDSDLDDLRAAATAVSKAVASVPDTAPVQRVLDQLVASNEHHNGALDQIVELMQEQAARDKRFDWKTWVLMLTAVLTLIITWKMSAAPAPITDADLDHAVQRAVASAKPFPSPSVTPIHRSPGAVPFARPAAGLSAPCPCGGGRKYRHCHGAT